jgi:hypothetical protein
LDSSFEDAEISIQGYNGSIPGTGIYMEVELQFMSRVTFQPNNAMI